MKRPDVKIIRVKFEEMPLSNEAFAVRHKVFVEEQGVDPKLEHDQNEPLSHHYAVQLEAKTIGTARWRETEKGIKLERFAILKEFRNKGIGEILLKEVMNDVLPLGKTIYLHAQLKAIPFYERHGFKKSGELFFEARMGHYYMEYSK
jgi:predicted GNAT family N-acyltransferase